MSFHGGASVSSVFISSIKTFFSTVYLKKTSTFVYTFIIIFFTFTLLLAHAPENLAPVAKYVTFEFPITNSTSLVAKNNSSQSLLSDKHTFSDPDVKVRNLDNNRAFKTTHTESKAFGSKNLLGSSTNMPLENQEIESLKNCEFNEGEWVKDNSYPLYKPGSCILIDEQFNCFSNGRPDNDFQKFKWKPKNCNLPRLNATKFLEMIRGRRLVFVGDSLNRNTWESLVCILKGSVKDKSQVFEVKRRNQFRWQAEYCFVFKEYDCTIEMYSSPFLVQEWETEDKNGTKKKTLRLDLMGKSTERYKDANIIIFNTGHWWNHGKTSKGKNFFQVGSFVYPKLHEDGAFLIALKTWSQWIDKKVNPKKSLVFFRSFSSTHYKGGQWNSGGACHNEIEPIKNETYLKAFRYKMKAVENVLRDMKTPVTYLNITRLTDYRKDGHPSIYRKQKILIEKNESSLLLPQDCGHWCLPGVPDTWNEILYAKLLVKLHQIDENKSDVVNINNTGLEENI